MFWAQRKIISKTLFGGTILTLALLSVGLNANVIKKVLPEKIALPLVDIDHTEMVVGDSRVLEVLYYSGKDNRNDPAFEVVTERDVIWTTQPEGIVAIDKYGRLEALKPGTVQVKVQSISNPKANDKRTLCVIDKSIKNSKNENRVVTYIR